MLFLNTLFKEHGVNPHNVLLVRHSERGPKGTAYGLWAQGARKPFEVYQSRQVAADSMFRKAPLWASFVVTPDAETLFIGLYTSTFSRVLGEDCDHPLGNGIERAGLVDCYSQAPDPRLEEYVGRVVIDWGSAPIQWKQWAANQNKPILEIRRSPEEPEFPGFARFIKPLSEIPKLPPTWIAALRNAKGVYLLTCLINQKHYVGSACGADGFWGRWNDYAANGHGGAVELQALEQRDFQVSILEVLGSIATEAEILAAEALWKEKLKSRIFGLNAN